VPPRSSSGLHRNVCRPPPPHAHRVLFLSSSSLLPPPPDSSSAAPLSRSIFPDSSSREYSIVYLRPRHASSRTFGIACRSPQAHAKVRCRSARALPDIPQISVRTHEAQGEFLLEVVRAHIGHMIGMLDKVRSALERPPRIPWIPRRPMISRRFSSRRLRKYSIPAWQSGPPFLFLPPSRLPSPGREHRAGGFFGGLDFGLEFRLPGAFCRFGLFRRRAAGRGFLDGCLLGRFLREAFCAMDCPLPVYAILTRWRAPSLVKVLSPAFISTTASYCQILAKCKAQLPKDQGKRI